jgi:hypothetical protein
MSSYSTDREKEARATYEKLKAEQLGKRFNHAKYMDGREFTVTQPVKGFHSLAFGGTSGLADPEWNLLREHAIVKKHEFTGPDAIGLIRDDPEFFNFDISPFKARMKFCISKAGIPNTIIDHDLLKREIDGRVNRLTEIAKEDIIFAELQEGEQNTISYIDLFKKKEDVLKEINEGGNYGDAAGTVKQFFRYLIFGKYGHNCKDEGDNLKKLQKIIKFYEVKITDSDIYTNYVNEIKNTDQVKYNTYLGLGKKSEHIISPTNDKSGGFLRKMENTIHLCQCYLDSLKNRLIFGMKVCKNREIEGKFINKSLEQIRSTLKIILTDKNEGNDFTVPNYPSSCGDYYSKICGGNCYNIESNSPLEIEDNSKSKGKDKYSLIIGDIFKYYQFQLLGEGGHVESLKDFHKKLLISVFCVANFSPFAHDPPPSPYIDISDLKIDYVKWVRGVKEGVEDVQDVQDLKRKLTTSLKSIDKRIDYYGEINNVGDTRDIDEKLKWGDKDIPSDQNTVLNHIIALDNNNAVSIMGSLEFLDKISKYYITDIVCEPDEENVDEIIKNWKTGPQL